MIEEVQGSSTTSFNSQNCSPSYFNQHCGQVSNNNCIDSQVVLACIPNSTTALIACSEASISLVPSVSAGLLLGDADATAYTIGTSATGGVPNPADVSSSFLLGSAENFEDLIP